MKTMRRKALIVGIDWYENSANRLKGCVIDACNVANVLKRNEDKSKNFDIQKRVAFDQKTLISSGALKADVERLFSGDDVDIALFYFSGHGSEDGVLCTSDEKGVPMNDILDKARTSQARHKIIILDCCFSGACGVLNNNDSVLPNGVVIFAACSRRQYAIARQHGSVFTQLFIDALERAGNLMGEITLGAIYAHIDKSLGTWEQRPIFRANVSTFISLRKVSPRLTTEELLELTSIFEQPDSRYQLDPSYEPNKNEIADKTPHPEHERIFALLQKFRSCDLVEPDGVEHMYYAALNSQTCSLTRTGQFYWSLAMDDRL